MEYNHNNIKTIGKRIKREYESLGYTMQAFAYAMGVNRGTIRNWINGETIPSLKELMTMCSDRVSFTIYPLNDNVKDESVINSHNSAIRKIEKLCIENKGSNSFVAPMFNCELSYLIGEIDKKTKAITDIAEKTGLSADGVEWLINNENAQVVNDFLVKSTKLFKKLDSYKSISGIRLYHLKSVDSTVLNEIYPIFERVYTFSDIIQHNTQVVRYIFREQFAGYVLDKVWESIIPTFQKLWSEKSIEDNNLFNAVSKARVMYLTLEDLIGDLTVIKNNFGCKLEIAALKIGIPFDLENKNIVSDYYGSPVMTEILDGILTHYLDAYPETKKYAYVFQQTNEIINALMYFENIKLPLFDLQNEYMNIIKPYLEPDIDYGV